MKRIISSLIILCLLFFGVLYFAPKEVFASTNYSEEDIQFIGYGYDVTAGKAISDPNALNLSSPILDVNNKDLLNYIKVFKASKTTYESNSSSSVSEISEQKGTQNTVGLGINAGGTIGSVAQVNGNIDLAFDISSSFSRNEIYTEEYSYYDIIAQNRPVVLQLDSSKLVNYLNEDYVNDLKGVKSLTDAKKIMKKYGTHLLTAYTLGGIFEMTNYYATNSSSYTKQSQTSFSAAINASISYLSFQGGADISYSFTENYGYSDNNQHAVNNYKCTTYGGFVFPGLTIDQAFSWYETLTDAGYMYKIWTESINRGENLVIVDVVNEDTMIPLWNLVPKSTEIGSNVRNLLVEAYVSLCQEALEDYKNNPSHQDKYALAMPTDTALDSDLKIDGYQYMVESDSENVYTSLYIDQYDRQTEKMNVVSGSIISMSFNDSEFAGHDLKWTLGKGDKYVKWLDERNCIFKVTATNNINDLTLSAVCDGVTIFQKPLYITNKCFSGGLGTEESPYLISSVADFKKIASTKYANGGYYYRIVNDIDFSDERYLSPIGTDSYPFNGTIDGGNHTLSNITLTYRNKATSRNYETFLSIFGYNKGTIKNINIDKCEVSSDETTDQYELLNMCAFVVNYNDQNGVIDNVKVTQSNIWNFIKNSLETNINKYAYCGAIASINYGRINKCLVKDSSVIAKLHYSKTNQICSGGIVGNNVSELQDNSVDTCMVDNVAVISQIVRNSGAEPQDNNTRNIYVGGIVGLHSKGIIANCLYKNADSNSLSSWVESNRGLLFVWLEGSNSKDIMSEYVGGIAGYVGTNASLSSCAIQNIPTISGDDYFTDNFKISLKIGTIAGDCEGTIEKCVSEKTLQSGSSSVQLPKVGNNKTWDINGDGINKNINKSLSDEYWIEKDGSYIPLIDDVVYSIDTSNVKKLFYYGDSFKVGKIEVTLEHSNGDVEYCYDFQVNFFNYEKNPFNLIEGNSIYYDIYVEAGNAKTSYTVEMKYPVVLTFNLSYKSEKEYKEGDTFDVNNLNIEAIFEDGTKQEIDHSVCSIKNLTNGSGLVLQKGENKIQLSYCNCSVCFNVAAKERPIKYIEVEQSSSYSENNFHVGDTKIGNDAFTVKGYYEEDVDKESPVALSSSACLFLFSTLEYGDNTVTVSYGDYVTDTIVVNATYDDIATKALNFIEIVDSIDITSNDLDKTYGQIISALNAYNELGDYTSTDVEDAYQTLEEIIGSYNSKVDTINSEMETAVEISSSFNYTVLFFASFSMLGFIILFIVKRFL